MASRKAPQPRLLVNAIDTKAEKVPDSPWILYAKSSLWEQEEGYRTITWKQLANAVNKTAFWLDENAPRTGSERQTIAYLGPNDPSYYILIAAAAKSKRRLFIPDGRITPEGLTKILGEIGCSAWLSTIDRPSPVPGQISIVFPSLGELLEEGSSSTLPYPYDETWEINKEDIVGIIHTSGTTGLPKPIYLRNGWMSVWDSWSTISSRHYPRRISFHHFLNARSLNFCPPQWAAAVAMSLIKAAFQETTTVMPPPDFTSPFNWEAVAKICQHNGATGIITPPALIEDFYLDPAAFNFLKSLDFVCYIGAPLDNKVGDALAPHTKLFPAMGTTEAGFRVSFDNDDATPELWKSFDFVPEMGPRFERIADGLYELHIDRTPEHDIFHGGFYTFPEKQSIETKELYEPVLDKDGSTRWVFQGRKDDLVKLSWLAKFHAADIEETIARHPQVAAVVVGGEGRPAPYIIIEPRDWTLIGNGDKFLDEIYNTVICGVNKKDNDEIRLPRETIMLSDSALPFKRTMKMTIMRKEVEKDYESRIDNLYSAWELMKKGSESNALA